MFCICNVNVIKFAFVIATKPLKHAKSTQTNVLTSLSYVYKVLYTRQ